MLLAAFTLVTFLDGLLVRAGASWEMAAGLCAHTETRLRFVSLPPVCIRESAADVRCPKFPGDSPDSEDGSETVCTLFRLTKFQIQPLVEKTLSSVTSRNAEDLTLDY